MVCFQIGYRCARNKPDIRAYAISFIANMERIKRQKCSWESTSVIQFVIKLHKRYGVISTVDKGISKPTVTLCIITAEFV